MKSQGKSVVYLARIFILLVILIPIYFITSIAGTSPEATYRATEEDVPIVHIRRGGYMDSSWLKIYIDRPIINRRILRLTGGIPHQLQDVPPPSILAATIRTTPSQETQFGIVWSSDGQRLACSFRGWLIGAYDLNTGEALTPERNNKESAMQAHQRIDMFLSR